MTGPSPLAPAFRREATTQVSLNTAMNLSTNLPWPPSDFSILDFSDCEAAGKWTAVYWSSPDIPLLLTVDILQQGLSNYVNAHNLTAPTDGEILQWVMDGVRQDNWTIPDIIDGWAITSCLDDVCPSIGWQGNSDLAGPGVSCLCLQCYLLWLTISIDARVLYATRRSHPNILGSTIPRSEYQDPQTRPETSHLSENHISRSTFHEHLPRWSSNFRLSHAYSGSSNVHPGLGKLEHTLTHVFGTCHRVLFHLLSLSSRRASFCGLGEIATNMWKESRLAFHGNSYGISRVAVMCSHVSAGHKHVRTLLPKVDCVRQNSEHRLTVQV
jgi:hypothetical protein